MTTADGSIVLKVTTKVDESIKKTIAEIKRQLSSMSSIKEEIAQTAKLIEEQKEKIRQLGLEMGKLAYSGQEGSEEYQKLKEQLSKANAELREMQSHLEELGETGSEATSRISDGFKEMSKRLGTMAKNILVMQQLYKVFRYMLSVFSDILMSDEEFKQDWEELKAAFYTAAYPIVHTIVPALKWIVEQLRDWLVSVGKIAAVMKGISYSELVDQAKASKETADNYEDIADSVEDIEKTLAGFDKIEILKADSKSVLGDDSSASAFDNLKKYDTSGEESMLGDLMKAIGGALAAVGLIMVNHSGGNSALMGWGFGFIVAGAYVWAVEQIWGSEYSENAVIDMIGKISKTIGDGLMAIGLILLKCGITKWGLGFIVAGAAIRGITEIWGSEFSADKVTDITAKIMLSIGAALAAIGLILIVFGQISLGIGFLVAGAIVFAVGEIAAHWDEMSDKTKAWITAIMAIVGAASLVIGIILCVTGVGIPVGVALIAVGAATLVTVVALNWDAIKDAAVGAFNAVVNWVKTYGLFVIGIILCLTGVGMSLGISLIIKWAKDNADEVPLANAILTKVKEIWGAVKDFWDKYIAPVFTAEWWKNLAKKCGNGLIVGFESAINGIIYAFETMINWIVKGLNKLSFELPDWVPGIGGSAFGINIPEANFGRVSIPRLAKGAVIPANREFLAVLGDQKSGTNIEAPLSTIEEAVENVLNRRGNETVKEEHYYLSETELMSIVYKLAKNGERVQGINLVGG